MWLAVRIVDLLRSTLTILRLLWVLLGLAATKGEGQYRLKGLSHQRVRETLTGIPVGLEDYSHRTGHIVHLPAHAGTRRAAVVRNCPLLQAHRNSDRILAEEDIAQVVDHHSFDKVVADRIGPEEVGSPAEEDTLPVGADSLDRSRVAGSPVGRTDHTDLT